jgi:hypothetical protein
MAKRLLIENTPPQVKEFLKQLDVERGKYVLEIGGKPRGRRCFPTSG